MGADRSIWVFRDDEASSEAGERGRVGAVLSICPVKAQTAQTGKAALRSRMACWALSLDLVFNRFDGAVDQQ